MDGTRDAHWRGVAEEGDDKKNIYTMRQEIYVKDKEKLIKRDILVSVPHLKGGNIVCNCVKDNRIA